MSDNPKVNPSSHASSANMSKISDSADPPDFGGVTEADGLIVAQPADY